jgi:PAS domain S-box-containing protein
MQNHPAPASRLALSDRSRQFELLLDSVTDYAIYMLDAEGFVRSWNAGGERIKGYRQEEIEGTHYSAFYMPEDVAQGLPMKNLQIAEREGRFSGEGWRLRKDGSRFRASVVIDPIWDEGELVGFAKVTRDVTERYRSEERLEQARQALLQSQKMEAIGKLTLGLAHDFNNLLTIIVNSLDVIDARAQNEKVSEMVLTALRASERGILLSRQLLTFGRGQNLAPERLDINQVIEGGKDLYRRCAGPAVTLFFDFAPHLPPVEIDRGQFEAALLNLVSNSRDAMTGGGSIYLTSYRCRRSDPADATQLERDYVCISVKDTGPGIPLEQQNRVFEPFYTTKAVGRGSGLGLSQVHGFAAQSGGFAELSSHPGEGTTVTMHFPPVGAF